MLTVSAFGFVTQETTIIVPRLSSAAKARPRQCGSTPVGFGRRDRCRSKEPDGERIVVLISLAGWFNMKCASMGLRVRERRRGRHFKRFRNRWPIAATLTITELHSACFSR